VKAKTILILVTLFAVVFIGGARAADKDAFWDTLRAKISKITPGKPVDTTTSVAGVRGAKNSSDSDVYWKGKDKTELIAEEELQKFNLAVETKIQGNNEQALKQFEAFLNNYPQSPLRLDALQAVEKIKIELGLIKAPEVRAEEPSDVKKDVKEEAPSKAPAKTGKKTVKKKAPSKDAETK